MKTSKKINPISRIKKDIQKLMNIMGKLDNLDPDIEPKDNMKIVKELEKSTIKLKKGINKTYKNFPIKENPEKDVDTKK